MPLLTTLHQHGSYALAEIEVQTADGDLCTGIIRWRDGKAVRAALLELERLVNDQILPLVDEAQERLERMDLSIIWQGAQVNITDLQMYEDKDVSFRCDRVVVLEMAQTLATIEP
jgi:hypothetical protein